MKRICFISHTSELNGAELNLLQILERMDKTRFYPSLVLPREGLFFEESRKIGIETKVIPAKWWLTERAKMWRQPVSWLWNVYAVLELSRWIKKKKIDLVFSNSSAVWIGALAATRALVPHIWYIHEILGGDAPQLSYIFGQKALSRKIARFSCRVLVNSSATEAFFAGEENVRLVYNGIPNQDEERDRTQVLSSQWGLESKDIVFGIVGKICKEKGQKEVIKAMGMLGKNQPVRLLIVGDVKSAAYVSELAKTCSAYNIKERVVFTGYQRDVLNVLRLMDCLIVASTAESFGRTIIEAMSVKTPVLAAKSGGIPEIIVHGTNGFLLTSREPEEIKEGMVSFIENRDVHRRMAEEGYKTVQEKFLLSEQIKKIEKILTECLTEHGGVN